MIKSVKAFEEYLVAEGKSAKTLESYLFDVNEFMKYLITLGVKSASKINRTHVIDFRKSLLDRKLRKSTINKKINSLSCFCKFLKMKSILPESENPVVLKEDRVKFTLEINTSVSAKQETS